MARPEAPPAWYDDLDGSLAEAWRLLARGVVDRRSGFHTPMLASLGRDGRPRARVAVLRAADPARWTLRFHTDRRSEKYAELRADARIALTGYDAGAKIQLRVEGSASLHADDAIADAAWSGSRPMSRACYGVEPGPGQGLADGAAFALPGDEAGIADGRRNFCAVMIEVQSIEWLYLAIAGHRRALFRRGGGAVDAAWLVP